MHPPHTLQRSAPVLSTHGVYLVQDLRKLRDLPASARVVARLFNGRRTVSQVCDLAGISMTGGLCLVQRLAQENIITTIQRSRFATRPAAKTTARPTRKTRTASGFTSFEEAFFSSEVIADDDWFEDEVLDEDGNRVVELLSRTAHDLWEKLVPVTVGPLSEEKHTA